MKKAICANIIAFLQWERAPLNCSLGSIVWVLLERQPENLQDWSRPCVSLDTALPVCCCLVLAAGFTTLIALDFLEGP